MIEALHYGHYWIGSIKATPDFLRDIAAVIHTGSSVIPLAGEHGHGAAIINKSQIRFNGFGTDGGQGLILKLHPEDADDDISAGQCITERKPYDAIVGAVLLVCSNHFSKFTLCSDGDWNREWVAARDLYFNVFSEEAKRPLWIDAVYDDYGPRADCKKMPW
ncbi:hypothetical protein ABW21_db0204552 [Orbilia brochopaga]|nr:hypothetical protein ABW21_db0204552 [Drechslerella brochopaga]